MCRGSGGSAGSSWCENRDCKKQVIPRTHRESIACCRRQSQLYPLSFRDTWSAWERSCDFCKTLHAPPNEVGSSLTQLSRWRPWAGQTQRSRMIIKRVGHQSHLSQSRLCLDPDRSGAVIDRRPKHPPNLGQLRHDRVSLTGHVKISVRLHRHVGLTQPGG